MVQYCSNVYKMTRDDDDDDDVIYDTVLRLLLLPKNGITLVASWMPGSGGGVSGGSEIGLTTHTELSTLGM